VRNCGGEAVFNPVDGSWNFEPPASENTFGTFHFHPPRQMFSEARGDDGRLDLMYCDVEEGGGEDGGREGGGKRRKG